MEWLGIHLPVAVKENLLNSENILAESVTLVLQIAKELIDFCKTNQVPFGFNIESVAIRKEEIEASIDIVNQIKVMLQENGVRA